MIPAFDRACLEYEDEDEDEDEDMMHDSRWNDLLQEVEAARQHFHVPGVGLGILADGQLLTGGVGVTDLRAPLDVDGDTLFQIGSISKTFTATLAAILAQQGRLDLDAPLRSYMPDFQVADPDVSQRVTPRILFSHTAGWLGDYFETENPSLASAVERMRWLPQTYPLGQLWSYNNASFYVAGRLIEVVTGKPFAQVVQEDLLTPLGMSDTGYRLTDLLTAKVAMGFSAVYGDEGTPQPGRWYGVGAVDPVGGLSSTARDMLRWAQFTIDGRDNEGKERLSLTSRELLRELRVPAEVQNHVGLCWFTRDLNGVRLMWHGGSMRYQQSRLIIAPERGFAIIALTNSERGSELIDRLMKTVLPSFLDITDTPPAAIPGERSALEPYVGRYSAALMQCDISLEDDTLWLRVTRTRGLVGEEEGEPFPPVRLALTATPDVLLAIDPPYENEQLEFLRNGGDIAWLRLGGRVHRRG